VRADAGGYQFLLDYRDPHNAFATILTPYRKQRWDEALELFRKCLRIRPEDGASKVMEWRCRKFRDNPPPEDWDGTFEDRRGRHTK
jgi:adenylate cyclase